MENFEYMARNLAAVRAGIAEAEEKAGRTGTRLAVAVKYALDGEVEWLLRNGVTEVGENRVQQLLAHAPLYEKYDTAVHFIGSLQTNKVKYIADKVTMIHSLDSLRLAEEIERQAAKHGRVINVLIEINSGRESAKSGVAPEEAEALLAAVRPLAHLRVVGFMTMGPHCETEEDYRVYFSETRALAHALWEKAGLDGKPILSMGMSESYRAAIAEGADIVRVGRSLFAGRPTEPTE